jgi:hypothetical protein
MGNPASKQPQPPPQPRQHQLCHPPHLAIFITTPPVFKPNYTQINRTIYATVNIATIAMSGTSSWLQKQRKSELVELADSVGLKMYDNIP